MQKEYQLAVDIEKKILTPSFEVNTLDLKTIKLKITITKGMTLVDLTDIAVRMSIRKPDGNVLFQDCQVVNAKGGQVEIILENQAYIMPGSYSAEIMCFKGADKVAVTGSFSYRSIRGIMDDKAIESKSEFTAITGMIGNVESLVNDLKENGTGIDAQARQEVQQVSEQLADILQQGVSCSQLGMTPNDSTKGADNFIKLTNAINQNKRILVDGTYYLEAKETVNINKDIQMDSISHNAKFFTKQGTYMKIVDGCKKISITGVTFDNTTTSMCLLFTVADVIRIDLINIQSSRFHGSYSLLRWSSFPNVNPETTKWGIGEFKFEKNYVYNTRASFIVLPDVPFDLYNINNNEVINFDYTFMTCAIANDHTYPDQIIKAMRQLNVRNNHVFCEDDWWGAGSSGTYYSFIVSEAAITYYEGNHVEGMKTDYLISVYDAYLSSLYVEYKNNTWKNNICFNTNKTNNTLMKAKGNGGERYYENNRFIIEENFATKFNKDKNLLKVDIYSCTSDIKRWVIQNNTVDVYFLEYPASAQTIDEQWIENNTFKSVISKGNILSFLSKSGINYSGGTHRLVNNTIVNSGTYDGVNFINLVRCTDYSNMSNLYPNVIISDNRVITTNLAYMLNETRAKNVVVERNRIEIPYSPIAISGGYGANTGYIENLQMSNNTFSKNHGKVYENRIPIAGLIEEETLIKETTGTHGNSNLSLRINNPISSKYRYTRTYEIHSGAGYSNFSYTVDYFYDTTDSKNKVTFTDSSGATNTYTLGEGAGSSTNIKLNGTVTGNLTVRFNNSSGVSNFYLNGLPDGYKTIKARTFTAIV